MSIKPPVRILLILLISLIIFLLLETLIITDAERVINTVKVAGGMIEKEDIDVLSCIDTSFVYQKYDYYHLEENLPSFFNEFERIKVEISGFRVSVSGPSAQCSIKARIIAWKDSMPVLLFGEVLAKSPAVISLKRTDNQWLIWRINAD